LQDRSRRVARESERLGHRLGRRPTANELAAELDETPAAVVEAIDAQRAYRADRLTDPETTDEGGDVRRLARALSVDDPGFDRVVDAQQLVWAIRRLPVRQRRVVLLRFYDGMTQTEIAERIGVSQMHVSRLVRSSLRSMRDAIEAAA
jgi:RNA polymerase sigma-B factor